MILSDYQGIVKPKKVNSDIWSAGNQGRFSNSLIDEIVLEFMIWIAKKEFKSAK
jgi:hypothetical protein